MKGLLFPSVDRKQANLGFFNLFAVFFKGRGNTSKDKSAASQGSLDRAQAIALVASIVEEAVKSCGGTVLVDLKKPQVCPALLFGGK